MEDKLAEIEEEHEIPPADVYTVSDLNDRIDGLVEAEPELADMYLLGEVSNCNTSSSGHMFLTLKDENSQVSCVMFSGHREKLDYELKDGDEILVQGTAEYYEKDGAISFKIRNVYPVGDGKYFAELRKRMKKLKKEGLFDRTHKQDTPDFPERIGIVTSRESAAVRDMVNAIHDRFPTVDVYVKHAAVQGENAVNDLVEGIAFFNDRFDVDVIVIGRGGGSIEDLQAFNSEELARTVFNSDVPVVSGVGHRTDETITGYVADSGTITPTAAGEQAVASKQKLERRIETLEDRLRDRYKKFKTVEKQKRQLELAMSREQKYRAIIAIQFIIIVILLGVILL